jgi:hypothetical protein
VAGRSVIVGVRTVIRIRPIVGNGNIHGARRGIIGDVIRGRVVAWSVIIRRAIRDVSTGHGSSRHT